MELTKLREIHEERSDYAEWNIENFWLYVSYKFIDVNWRGNKKRWELKVAKLVLLIEVYADICIKHEDIISYNVNSFDSIHEQNERGKAFIFFLHILVGSTAVYFNRDIALGRRHELCVGSTKERYQTR